MDPNAVNNINNSVDAINNTTAKLGGNLQPLGHLDNPTPTSTVATSTDLRKTADQNNNVLSTALGNLPTTNDKNNATSEATSAYDNFTNQLNELGARSDATTKNLISGISAQYAGQKAQEQDQNDRYIKGLQALGLQTGTAQALPYLQSGTIRQAQIEGHKQLASIDAQERKALADAYAAKDAKDLELFNNKVSLYKDLQTQKRQAISDLYDQALQSQAIQSGEVDLVSKYAPGLYSDFSTLNDDEKQSYIDEVSKQLNVSPQSVVAALASEKERQDQVALDTKYKQSQISKNYQTSSSSSDFKLTSAQKSNLIGTGFTTDIISNITQDINDGIAIEDIKSGLGGATRDQLRAIDDIFGQTSAADKKMQEAYDTVVSSVLALDAKKMEKLLSNIGIDISGDSTPADLPEQIYNKISTDADALKTVTKKLK